MERDFLCNGLRDLKNAEILQANVSLCKMQQSTQLHISTLLVILFFERKMSRGAHNACTRSCFEPNQCALENVGEIHDQNANNVSFIWLNWC
jgi:hypothetical protein